MSGSITIQPSQAQLLNPNNALANIVPYWTIILGDQSYDGKVCKFPGPNPQWDDSLTLKVQGEPAFYFETQDSSTTTDDILGVCEVPLDEVYVKNKISQSFSLYHNQQEVGQVTINVVFQPDNTQTQSLPLTTQTQETTQTQQLSQSQPQSGFPIQQQQQETQSFGQTTLQNQTQQEKETKSYQPVYEQPYGTQYPQQQYQQGYPQQTQVTYGQQQVGGYPQQQGFAQQQTYPQQQQFQQQTYPQQTYPQQQTFPQQQTGFVQTTQTYPQQQFQQTFPQQQTGFVQTQTFPQQQTGFIQIQTYPQQATFKPTMTYTPTQQGFVQPGTNGFVQTTGYAYPQQQVYMSGTPISTGIVYTNPNLPTFKPYGGSNHFPIGGMKMNKYGKIKVKKFGRRGSSSSDSD